MSLRDRRPNTMPATAFSAESGDGKRLDDQSSPSRARTCSSAPIALSVTKSLRSPSDAVPIASAMAASSGAEARLHNPAHPLTHPLFAEQLGHT
jgi:hypothetical protein